MGSASSIAVEIADKATGTVLGNGSSLIQPVLADRTVTYAMNTRAFSVNGNIMPGNINAVVQATFTYN